MAAGAYGIKAGAWDTIGIDVCPNMEPDRSRSVQEMLHAMGHRVHEKVSGKVISIDGKTVRGSKSDTRNPIHMISAWVSEQQMVLGQRCVEEKTNEITTVPLLLKLLDISGCIVTADAMSCQREIIKAIVDRKGDYVLRLKENQPMLYEYAEIYF